MKTERSRRTALRNGSRSELVALLDLGSSALRLVRARIVPRGAFLILEEGRAQIRLASGGQSSLPQRAVRETLRAVDAFLDSARRRDGARVIALATAAVRDAHNAEALLGPL